MARKKPFIYVYSVTLTNGKHCVDLTYTGTFNEVLKKAKFACPYWLVYS
ncbi:hypothetical protein AAAZ63_05925 [Bacteroides xylanisolvens]